MKRLALLLGSLLVVSAAASAKEVVPAPVVVEETPVQIVEKEVIVYRDREPEWRPSGFVSLEQKYYGRTEDQKEIGGDNWNKNNEYMRTQALASINLTPNQKMDIRGRLYQGTHRGNKYEDKADEFRVRYFYDHGTLGDTKIDMTSKVKYLKKGSGRGKQTAEYILEFDFAKYMFNNDYVKTTKFAVGPSYSYVWADNGYENNYGIYFNWENELPFGFGTELEFDSAKYSVASSKIYENGTKEMKDKKFTLPVKFLITHSYNLWQNDAYALDWHAEAGYDTYVFSNLKSEPSNGKYSNKAYTLKLEPSVTLTYKATNYVSVYGTLGAEYRNWVKTNQKDASNWRWQPYAAVGVKTTF